jgi:hypothetical protein
MRIAQKIALAVAIAAQVVLVSGCTSPVPPTVTRAPMSPLDADPTIFLQTSVQRPRIAESLRKAGVRLTESYAEADYILNVNVGRRRNNQTCGGSSNIAYVLDGRGRHLMVIKGRGLTGTCVPNVFDDMSQKLATYFGG